MFWKRILYYLNPLTLFEKNEDETKDNFSLKAMHGMNRISILVFLLCVVLMVWKFVLN